MARNKDGFTIIEVVLVLAIAGLIFLMVFVALPALQRSQRDTQRRQDMSRVVTALTNYQANNNGNLPSFSGDWSIKAGTDIDNCGTGTGASSICGFVRDYLNPANANTSEFKDPDGTRYGLAISKTVSENSNLPTDGAISNETNYPHVIFVKKGAKCGVEQNVSSYWQNTGKVNDFAVMYKLEGSGVACVDNQ